MSDQILVKVEGVSKKYCRTLKRSLWYGVQDVASEVLGREGHHDELRKNEFWAVKDVSFELKRGECLGLIGPNGAGKSTLLKMLNGLVKPDQGRITMRGRVGALIELGAGFNPILTARENIYTNGAVLGFGKKEIDSRFDAIVDFAEVEEFLDMPVQNFSSGMRVRLGFAVAAQMEPDVLLIDEVLAVGDAGFRAKCFNAIQAISKESAVILVSHQMAEIARSSSKAMLLVRNQCIAYSSEVSSVIRYYFDQFKVIEPTLFDSEIAKILAVRVLDSREHEVSTFCYLDDVLVEIDVEVDKKIVGPELGVAFSNENRQLVLQSNTRYAKFDTRELSGCRTIRLKLPRFPLGPGNYLISVGIDGPMANEILARWADVKKIRIDGDFVGHAPVVAPGEWTVIP